MREIKFRAWDKKKGAWCDDVTNHYNGFSMQITVEPGIELMQFTGLKDKNGRDIYEGDIVKTVWNEAHIIESEMMMENDYMYIFGWDMGGEKFEVIGNKFENPELI